MKTLLVSDKIFNDKILPLAKIHSACYKILKTPFIFNKFFNDWTFNNKIICFFATGTLIILKNRIAHCNRFISTENFQMCFVCIALKINVIVALPVCLNSSSKNDTNLIGWRLLLTKSCISEEIKLFHQKLDFARTVDILYSYGRM